MRAHPPGVALEALEEWSYSSRGFFRFSCLNEEFLSYLPSPQVRVQVTGVSARLQEEPSSLRTEREVHQESPWLLVRPSRVRVCRPRPPRVRAYVAGSWRLLRKELPSLCTEQEGRQEFFWLFERPSHFLFARKEGLFCRAPSCASLSRWASAMVCRKSPLASAWSKRAVRDSPDFLFDPRSSFSLGRRGGMCHATLSGRERWYFR